MIYIGSKSFNSQKELDKYTKQIIYSHLNQSITPIHQHWDFFNNLFNRHYQREWFGDIKQVTFVSNDKYYKPMIYCSKGVETISINLCVSARKPTYKEQLAKVMRALIEPEIIGYRLDNNEPCAKCGTVEDLQTDHEIPFSKLRDDFLKIYGDPPSDFHWGENNRLISKDFIFNNSWKVFHLNNATFQTLCKKCNLKKSNSIIQNENPSNC
jgi:5-methylcytosine-specific restriction endonuclease McrA